jgi:SAM-dependent methyltransferase
VVDVWATVADLDPAMQDRLAAVLETRGAEPGQQAMRRAFLAEVSFPPSAQVLEVGCGTGVLTRALARLEDIDSVVGVDVAPSLLSTARELAAGLAKVRFEAADARALPFPDESFDVAVFDSTLSHVREPERALAEAFRVLRRGGRLAAFDGDYATTTVALGDHDPLQVCVDAMMADSVGDRRVMRRLPALVRACGFRSERTRSHGFVETGDGAYMLTIIDRGADILRASERIGADLAAALKAEGRRRIAEGAFFGHIAYVSLVAGKGPAVGGGARAGRRPRPGAEREGPGPDDGR